MPFAPSSVLAPRLEATLALKSFGPSEPGDRQELLQLTKKFLVSEAPEKIFSGDGTLLAENFRFVGPYIGPLDKKVP